MKAPSETAAVDIVAREQDSPAGRRNKKIENTDFDIVARNSLRHHKKKRMKWTIFKEFLFPAHFHVFLLHEKVTDDEGVPSLSAISLFKFFTT